ncbi:MAG TPA: HAMP domain-containing sensor histidine kinase [Puia sp.]|nr:HAMP domain-containing sensor histidine kinase [Puia sp.]
MIFKRYQERILIRVLFMFITLSGASFLMVKGRYEFLSALVPVIIFQLVDFYNFHRKAQYEVEQFVESIHYRDFSRHFDVKQAPVELQSLRQGFNEINTTFKHISRERETQYQYLQKILELVNTGILSYEHKSGDISWMNEAFKNMLGIPYLKTIHSLERRDENLYQEILNLRPGENKVVPLVKDGNSFKTLMAATAFQTDGKIYKLIAFQDVNEALDEQEAKSWKKLLSVMTHEIMNSVAPIASLAETLSHRLQASAAMLEGQPGALEDLQIGVGTIRRRSEGLLKFAETYRSLNKITTLNLTKVYVRDLFENLHVLMEPTFEQKGIEMEIILKDPDMTLDADISLIEQVLINLVVNAVDAVKESAEPTITLSGTTYNGRPLIRVADNGTGMSPEVMDNIFIPFFSTKKTGSGIGLSLCKQIMLLHKGNIQVQSIEGEGSAFLMQF